MNRKEFIQKSGAAVIALPLIAALPETATADGVEGGGVELPNPLYKAQESGRYEATDDMPEVYFAYTRKVGCEWEYNRLAPRTPLIWFLSVKPGEDTCYQDYSMMKTSLPHVDYVVVSRGKGRQIFKAEKGHPFDTLRVFYGYDGKCSRVGFVLHESKRPHEVHMLRPGKMV